MCGFYSQCSWQGTSQMLHAPKLRNLIFEQLFLIRCRQGQYVKIGKEAVAMNDFKLCIVFTQVFRGNIDNNTPYANSFTPPIKAQYVRLYPQVCRRHCTLRMELLGCELSGKSQINYFCILFKENKKHICMQPVTNLQIQQPQKCISGANCLQHGSGKTSVCLCVE